MSVVAVGVWQLMLPGSRSLKEKRMVIRSLKDRIRRSFNVSVAETGHQDTWGRAEFTVALVASDRGAADSLLDGVDRLMEGESRAVIVDTRREWC
jgi:uncharacterized protein